MSFHKNNNYLNLTPRTHISVESGNKDDSKPVKLVKSNKLDKVDLGLKKLIFLGKIIRNYFPHKDHLLKRKGLLEIKESDSHKKLTPFQAYLKSKKLISIKLKNKRNHEIKLKAVKSEKNFKKRNDMNTINSYKRISLNKNNSPNKYYNTIGCSFKNKLIKSVFEKNKNKNKMNLQYKIFNFTETNYITPKNKYNTKDTKDLIKFRYLLSNENIFNNKAINFVDDLRYEKDKMLLLNKQKILKKKKNNNLFNEKKFSHIKINSTTFTEETNKTIYNHIPLIDIPNFSISKNNFDKFILNQNIKKNIFKRKRLRNTYL